MIRCERVQADAAGLAALPAGDPEREAAWAHARGCAACARALADAARLHALIADRPTLPPLAADLRARVSRAVVSDLRREMRRKALSSAIGVVAAFAAAVLLARHRSPSAHDRYLALGLGAAALGLGVAAASRRWTVSVIVAASVAAFAAAVGTGRAGALDAAVGVHCLATELACAFVVVLGAWVAIRRGTSALGARGSAAAAAAGALAGLAALELTCPARHALAHLLAFHAGGVLLAWGATAALSRVGPPRQTFR